MRMSASGNYINLGSTLAGKVDKTKGAVSCIVHVRSQSGIQEIWDLRHSVSEMELNHGDGSIGGIYLRFAYPGSNININPNPLVAGSLAHLMVTYDSTGTALYMNGAQLGTGAAIGAWSGSFTLFYIANDNFSEYFIGSVGQFHWWDFAPPVDCCKEITGGRRHPMTVHPGNQIIRMPMIAGQPIRDEISNLTFT